MGATALKGKKAKVTVGANTVVGMGTWKLPGISSDELDTTEFGDNFKHFILGLMDGGTGTFNGLFDPTDATGQEILRKANVNQSALPDLRFYIDNTSYFAPCQTSGYFLPDDTTGNDTELSTLYVSAVDIDTSQNGLANIAFSVRLSGVMVLV